MAFARSSELWRLESLALIRALVDNFIRLVGYYFDARGDDLSDSLCRQLSRDKRLMLGLSTPSRETGNI